MLWHVQPFAWVWSMFNGKSMLQVWYSTVSFSKHFPNVDIPFSIGISSASTSELVDVFDQSRSPNSRSIERRSLCPWSEGIHRQYQLRRCRGTSIGVSDGVCGLGDGGSQSFKSMLVLVPLSTVIINPINSILYCFTGFHIYTLHSHSQETTPSGCGFQRFGVRGASGWTFAGDLGRSAMMTWCLRDGLRQ